MMTAELPSDSGRQSTMGLHAAAGDALDRDAVVGAAASLINSEGADALTMSRVATDLGVSQPALYRHVNGVTDLWRALGLQARSDLAESLAQASVGWSGGDALRAVATAWRDFGQRNPGCYRSTERFAVAGDPELEAAVERVVEVLILSLRGFNLADDDAVHGARAVRSALHGFVTFELGDGHPAPVDADESFGHLIDLLCGGFENLSRHASKEAA